LLQRVTDWEERQGPKNDMFRQENQRLSQQVAQLEQELARRTARIDALEDRLNRLEQGTIRGTTVKTQVSVLVLYGG